MADARAGNEQTPSDTQDIANAPNTDGNENETQTRTRSSTQSSGRLRSASLRFLESSPPSGFLHATGTTLAQAPTPMEIRRGEFGRSGWDGPIIRRNSSISEESMSRLSRQSTAQTPTTLTKTKTNTLEAHAEAEDEGHPLAKKKPTGVQQPSTSKVEGVTQRDFEEDDDDDPFSKFVGRGRIDSQVFDPKTKITPGKEPEIVKDAELGMDDDSDSLDELDPRPKKRLSKLPNKFVDPTGDVVPQPDEKAMIAGPTTTTLPPLGPDSEGVYPNGYKFPPEHTWGEATLIGLKAFWKFTITPLGFLIVIYGLNVVAWGGMLFLLLIGGGDKYMCFPHDKPPGYRDCNDLNSPRRIWIEVDSQILNALFCVTGFGLIPWRFRDLYYLLQYRIRGQQSALRRLAGIHRAWFRLPVIHELPIEPGAEITNAEANPAIPLPTKKMPDPPLTGFRAPASKLWKLDYVIWAYVLNTFLQAVLSGFMWGLNRYDRPSWSTGTFVALACIVAALGGLMAFQEGKRVKAVEGIPLEASETLRDVEKQPLKGGKEKVAPKIRVNL